MEKREFTEVAIDGLPPGQKGPDGKLNIYRLFYDYNLIVDAEEQTKLNLLQPIYSTDRMTAGQLRALTYALLKTDNPQVELKDAGDFLGIGGDDAVQAVIKELGMQASDEALYRTLARMAIDRPAALLDMLARIYPLVPQLEPEAKPAAAKSSEEPPAVQ